MKTELATDFKLRNILLALILTVDVAAYHYLRGNARLAVLIWGENTLYMLRFL